MSSFYSFIIARYSSAVKDIEHFFLLQFFNFRISCFPSRFKYCLWRGQTHASTSHKSVFAPSLPLNMVSTTLFLYSSSAVFCMLRYTSICSVSCWYLLKMKFSIYLSCKAKEDPLMVQLHNIWKLENISHGVESNPQANKKFRNSILRLWH